MMAVETKGAVFEMEFVRENRQSAPVEAQTNDPARATEPRSPSQPNAQAGSVAPNARVRASDARVYASDVSAGPARPFAPESPGHMFQQISRALAEFDAEPTAPARTPAASAVPSNPARAVPSDLDEAQVIRLLLKNASLLAKAKEHRLTQNLLRNVLIRSPEHPEALEQMGASLREEGRLDEALKCFRALAKTTRSADAQVLVAETLYLQERDDMALAAYREALRRGLSNPNHLFETYKNVGNIHVRARDFDSAEEFYDKAYLISPESDVLMVNYGTLEIQRENFSSAVERFRRAVEINPDSDRGWVGLAMVHRLMGDRELAKANIERALDTNSQNRTAIRLVVEWCAEEMSYGSAIRRLQDYLAGQGGEDAEMAFTLAKIFTQVGRFSEARIEMERVLALDPFLEGAEALAGALDAEIARREEKK